MSLGGPVGKSAEQVPGTRRATPSAVAPLPRGEGETTRNVSMIDPVNNRRSVEREKESWGGAAAASGEQQHVLERPCRS